MQKKIAVTIFENLEASKGELTEIPFSRFKKALTQRMGVTNKKSLPLFVCSEFVKYKSFDHGVKDRPRHPVFLGFRSAEDLGG